jgi:hypothetical protein
MTPQCELKGTALKVYVLLVNENRPIGPRELTRLANLSSPSEAYRQLQRLEELGLIKKNGYGEHTVRQKQKVKSYLLVGGKLFPRIIFTRFLCRNFKRRSSGGRGKTLDRRTASARFYFTYNCCFRFDGFVFNRRHLTLEAAKAKLDKLTCSLLG